MIMLWIKKYKNCANSLELFENLPMVKILYQTTDHISEYIYITFSPVHNSSFNTHHLSHACDVKITHLTAQSPKAVCSRKPDLISQQSSAEKDVHITTAQNTDEYVKYILTRTGND